MIRKILAAGLCLLLIVSLAVPTFAASGDAPELGSGARNPFTDVTEERYYYAPVLWAVSGGITAGTSETTFSPAEGCTRGQIVTFLWRAAGSPKASADTCAFTDVSQDAYYSKAVLWAVEKGIVAGTSQTTFSPGDVCTRGQAVTFLYRYAGSPAVTGESCAFTDVSENAYYFKAVLWAAKNGVTAGTSETAFSPFVPCTRGQIVTFLYNALTGEALDPGDETDGTAFVFSDSGITASGNIQNSYAIDGTALTISGAGTYSVSGACADGSIKVKKGTTGVTLILNGLTLSSADTAPISCNKSTEVIITAAAGTVNTLTDSALNNDETYPDNTNAENAVIKCKDDARVTFCGTGTLNVIANGKNGIKGGATTDAQGEARITVRELTLNITADVNDGLKSDQELDLLSGAITIKAADDAIKSDYVLNIGASGTAGPTILIDNCYEGIEAATLNIYSGSITVHSRDDGMNAANSDLQGYDFSLNIYGGEIYIDALDDGLDSNGTLTLAGGTVEVFSSFRHAHSPLDSGRTMTLTGGTVLAVGSTGMVQTPDQASQAYVSIGAGGTARISIAGGDVLVLRDAAGNTVYGATAVQKAKYVFFTSPELVSGQTYTLLINGTAAATATAGK